MGILTTTWAFPGWVGNASFHPEKLSLKPSKNFSPPVAGWILVKSVFPEFTRVLVSHLDPFLGNSSLFWIHWSKILLIWTPHTRLSSLGTQLVWATQKVLWTPNELNVSYQSPVSCFWENDLSFWCPPSTCVWVWAVHFVFTTESQAGPGMPLEYQ